MERSRPAGALATVHPSDLLAQVLTQLIERAGVDPGTVDDVLVGCVRPSRRAVGLAWAASLAGDWVPQHVPFVTIERKCGSGRQALDFAVHGVVAGAYEVVIVAAGIESMSWVPLGSNRAGADPTDQGSPRGSRIWSARARQPNWSPTAGG